MTPTPHTLLSTTPFLCLLFFAQTACNDPCDRPGELCATTTDTDTDPSSSTSADTSTSGTVTTDPTSTSSSATSTSAPPPFCGDGRQDPDEECDNAHGNADHALCTLACKLNVCGDGLLLTKGGFEECDHGDANADDAPCTSACKKAICGDGLLLSKGDLEQCDHGDANADHAPCTSACKLNICGDGLLLKEGDAPEECDDANTQDDDGCTASCLLERLVFVSSVERKGNSSADGLKGLAGADALCQGLALAAGLPPDHTYMAWLSTQDQGPAARFPPHTTAANGPFKLLNKTPIATSWQDLTDGQLLHPIDLDENQNQIPTSTVWTNTAHDGKPAQKGDCDAWNSSMGFPKGGVGYSAAQDPFWTDLDANLCSNSARIYCFQVQP